MSDDEEITEQDVSSTLIVLGLIIIWWGYRKYNSTSGDKDAVENPHAAADLADNADNGDGNRAQLDPPRGTKSVGVAYLLYVLGGWWGLHHFYLGRDAHCFLWCTTAGGFGGLGLLRDFFCLPRYVREANLGRRMYQRYDATGGLVLQGKPPLGTARSVGMFLVGMAWGYLCWNLVPYADGAMDRYLHEHDNHALDDGKTLLRQLLAAFGCAAGVFLVATLDGGRTRDANFRQTFLVAFACVIVARVTALPRPRKAGEAPADEPAGFDGDDADADRGPGWGMPWTVVFALIACNRSRTWWTDDGGGDGEGGGEGGDGDGDGGDGRDGDGDGDLDPELRGELDGALARAARKQWARRFARGKGCGGGRCRRLVGTFLCVALFWSAVMYAAYHNGTVESTVAPGVKERVPIKKAVRNFLDSPGFREFKTTCSTLWVELKRIMANPELRKTFFDKVFQQFDLGGDARALETLGLAKDQADDTAAIKKAYRSLVRVWHPDKHVKASAAEQEEASKKFMEIQEAYEHLTNKRRKRGDTDDESSEDRRARRKAERRAKRKAQAAEAAEAARQQARADARAKAKGSKKKRKRRKERARSEL